MSVRHSILNFSGFFSITSLYTQVRWKVWPFHSILSGSDFVSVASDLWKAENRLLGLSSTGPMGSMVPRSLTQCRYPLVMSAMPIALAEQYMNLYPFLVRGKQSAVWLLYSINLLYRFPFCSSHSQADFVVEACDPLVGPIFTQRGEDVTQGVWPTAWQKKNK